MQLFILEKPANFATDLKSRLPANGSIELQHIENPRTLLEQLPKQPSLVVLDCALLESELRPMLKRIREHSMSTNVIVLCEQHETPQAQSWLDVFRFDYLVKDENTSTRLWNSVQRAFEQWSAVQAMKRMRTAATFAVEQPIEQSRVQDEGFGLLLSEERSMRAYEHMILQSFLDKYNHNVQLVARKLQIGKSTIYRMLKEVEETT